MSSGSPAALGDKLTMYSNMGGYRIGKLLGQGAMGKVYLAEHEVLGRPAAIKVLHAAAADKDAVARFFQEARAASAIEHPGIVKVYDVGENEDGSYLVMELLEGENLEERLLRQERFDVHDAVRFAVQIASALQAAHENGIVHRDLKPGNIFIVPDAEVSGGERIKILDFGIAKMVSPGDADANTAQTRGDILLGSPTYMSPEQCRGAQKVDGRADLYSLGCILFEMLCGRPPFDQQTVAEVIAAHLRQEPPTPTASRPEISPGLEKIILRLLAKKADERYQSADDFIAAMVQQGGHSLVVKAGVTRTLMSASQAFSSMFTEPKRRPLGALVVLALVGLIVALVFFWPSGDDGPREPGDELAAGGEEGFVPEELPEPPRPQVRVRMLAAAGDQSAGRQGEASGGIITIAEIKEMDWDGPIDEELITKVMSGDLDIGVLQGIPLLTMGPGGKLIVPWFIETTPPGARVTFADGTPLADGVKTPVFLDFEAVQRDDTLIVQLDGYEPETIAAKFYMPLREELELEPIPEVTIDTAPSGAEIYVDGDKLEGQTTPWTTKLSRKRDYAVSFRSPEYEDLDVTLRGGMNFSKPLPMKPLTQLELVTRPRKVDVLEDGQVICTTPCITRKFSVQKGQPFSLTLSGGERYEDMVLTLGPGQDLSFAEGTIELVPKVEIEVRTGAPRKAQIVDQTGALLAETPHTFYVSRSAPPQTVTLRHEDYEDYPLALDPNVELPRKIEMREIPEWTVESRPKKAEIYGAAGDKLGVTPVRFKVPLAVGTIPLVLRSPGHEDLAVTLRNDEKPPRRFELVELPSVEVETRPTGVEVFDKSGRKLGETPLLIGFKPGDPAKELTLRKAGYAEQTVRVSPDEKLGRVELERLAVIEIESRPPGARVLDESGRELGLTPWTTEVPRSRDKLVFKVALAGHLPETVDVVPSRDRKERVTLESEPTDVTVVIVSEPPGAEVYIGRKKLGETPYTETRKSSSGRTKYTLRMDGYKEESVRVDSSKSEEVRIELQVCVKDNTPDPVTGIVDPYKCK